MRTFRFIHVGVAAAMAAATVSAIGLVHAVGAGTPGTPSVLVPITPCRLLDTRAGADNVGSRATAIGPDEVALFQVTGTNGNCTIPASATGIATNATAVNPSSASYVTIFPADVSPRPTASNLNFVAGAAPTPNQVTTGLSATGAIGIYNLAGTVDVVVDIVGYYQATGGTGATGAQGPQGPQGLPGPQGPQGVAGPAGPTCPAGGCVVLFSGTDAQQNSIDPTYVVSSGTNCLRMNPAGFTMLGLDLPYGARITKVVVHHIDDDLAQLTTYRVNRVRIGLVAPVQATTASDSTDNDADLTLTPTAAGAAVVSATVRYQLFASPGGTQQYFCGATVTYVLP